MSIKNWISLHIPTPKYMSMSHVGIDISPTAIHMAEIKRRGSHLELGKYGVVKLDNLVNFNEPLTNDKNLLNSLKKLQKDYHLQFVEVSIPEEQAYIFTSELPQGDENTIRNHIELHLEENVPISLSDAVYDYHVIDKPFEIKDKDGIALINDNISANKKTNLDKVNPEERVADAYGEVKVLTESAKNSTSIDNDNKVAGTDSVLTSDAFVVNANSGAVSQIDGTQEGVSEGKDGPVTIPGAEANTPVSMPNSALKPSANTFFASISVVPKILIDQYIDLFEKAGMVPVSFLVENQAVSKAVIKKGDLRTKLIVHVGNKKTVLSVVSNGSVHFTSTVNIGSEDFTAAIMKEFNVSREEAIRMKTEKGFLKNGLQAGNGQVSIFMSLINTASALKDEIDRIVLYWQSYVSKHSSSGGSIENIILSGRDSLINGFSEYLRATVRLPVDTANVWINIYDLDVKIPDIDYIDSLDFAVAIGLGLPKIGNASH